MKKLLTFSAFSAFIFALFGCSDTIFSQRGVEKGAILSTELARIFSIYFIKLAAG